MEPQDLNLDGHVPQGSILGPVLFELFITCITRTLMKDSAACFTIYADHFTVSEATDFSDPDHVGVHFHICITSFRILPYMSPIKIMNCFCGYWNLQPDLHKGTYTSEMEKPFRSARIQIIAGRWPPTI